MSCELTHESNCSLLSRQSFSAASRGLRLSWYAVSEIFAAFSYPSI